MTMKENFATCGSGLLWRRGDVKAHMKKVLRHEIVHAFMFESGLAENWEHKDYGQEETVVDWFAIQGPKIYRAWTEAGAV